MGKINYMETFSTKHTRDYYRGKSFHFAGNWTEGVHYIQDEYTCDFVVHKGVLLACSKSNLATVDNEPKDFVKNSDGNIIGINSTIWNFVLAGTKGNHFKVRINPTTFHWETQENDGEPWVDTGVGAKLNIFDLSPDEIKELQKPGLVLIEDFVNNIIVQVKGDNENKVISQKAITLILDEMTLKVEDSVGKVNAMHSSFTDLKNKVEINETVTNTSILDIKNDISDIKTKQTKNANDISNEKSERIDADNTLRTSLNAKMDKEIVDRENENSNIRGEIQTEKNLLLNKINQSAVDIDVINRKIPAEATYTNQLADKDYVNRAVSTSEADFKGTYDHITELRKIPANKNDYGFVEDVDALGNKIYQRYKYNGNDWIFEYSLNSTTFTERQWKAVNSGITSELVAKINETPDNISETYVKKEGLVIVAGDGVNSTKTAKGEHLSTFGPFSHAEGRGNTVTGANAHVEGYQNKADGDNSHAEGFETWAKGINSHTEGNKTIASGESSHSEGVETNAGGKGSHAEGFKTMAAGNYSHAEGRLGVAIGDYSHVESSRITNVTLLKTSKPEQYIARLDTNSVDLTGCGIVLPNFTVIAIIINSIYNRVDFENNCHLYNITVNNTHSELESIPDTGKTFGIVLTKASGAFSHSEGGQAIGSGSHAEYSGVALGGCSHAEGNLSIAKGNNSHAEGFLTQAIGKASHSEGLYNLAVGKNSHIEGDGGVAEGENSHVQGGAKTEDKISILECTKIADKKYKIVFKRSLYYGYNKEIFKSLINGSYLASFSNNGPCFGNFTKITNCESVEGYDFDNIGYNNALIAEIETESEVNFEQGFGYLLYLQVASGAGSQVSGCNTRAIGDYSEAHGIETITKNDGEVAFGIRNVSHSIKDGDGGDTLFSVGKDDNVFEITKQGGVYIKDVGGYDGKNLTTSLQQTLRDKANKFGEYKGMFVGRSQYASEILDDKSVIKDNASFSARPTGGDKNIKTGSAAVMTMRGKTIKQILRHGNFQDLAKWKTNSAEIYRVSPNTFANSGCLKWKSLNNNYCDTRSNFTVKIYKNNVYAIFAYTNFDNNVLNAKVYTSPTVTGPNKTLINESKIKNTWGVTGEIFSYDQTCDVNIILGSTYKKDAIGKIIACQLVNLTELGLYKSYDPNRLDTIKKVSDYFGIGFKSGIQGTDLMYQSTGANLISDTYTFGFDESGVFSHDGDITYVVKCIPSNSSNNGYRICVKGIISAKIIAGYSTEEINSVDKLENVQVSTGKNFLDYQTPGYGYLYVCIKDVVGTNKRVFVHFKHSYTDFSNIYKDTNSYKSNISILYSKLFSGDYIDLLSNYGYFSLTKEKLKKSMIKSVDNHKFKFNETFDLFEKYVKVNKYDADEYDQCFVNDGYVSYVKDTSCDTIDELLEKNEGFDVLIYKKHDTFLNVTSNIVQVHDFGMELGGNFPSKIQIEYYQNLTDKLRNIPNPPDIALTNPSNGSTSALRALFVSAGAKYNISTGFYELNGLTDITEEQMIVIYNSSNVSTRNAAFIDGQHTYSQARTLFPPTFNPIRLQVSSAGFEVFYQCANLEVLYLLTSSAHVFRWSNKSLVYTFAGCIKLKNIVGKLNVSGSTFNNTFQACNSLINISLEKLSNSVSFVDSANLSNESILFMIKNATNGTQDISITLHLNAKARALADAQIQSAITANGHITII